MTYKLHEFTPEQKRAVAIHVGESVVDAMTIIEAYYADEAASSVVVLADVNGTDWSITVERSND